MTIDPRHRAATPQLPDGFRLSVPIIDAPPVQSEEWRGVPLVDYMEDPIVPPHPVFVYLRSKGLLTRQGLRTDRISGQKPKVLVDTADQVSRLLVEVSPQDRNGVIACCSQEMAGGVGGLACTSLKCRLAAVRRMGRFAALFADHVYIPNPVIWCDHFRRSKDPEILSNRLAIDLSVLLEMRCLVDAGLVSFLDDPTRGMCRSCAHKHAFSPRMLPELAKAATSVRRNLENVLDVEIWHDKVFRVRWRDPSERLHRCGLIESFRGDTLPALLRRPTLLEKIRKGGKIRASKSLVCDLELARDITQRALSSIVFALATSTDHRAPILTDLGVHAELLQQLLGDNELQKRNATLAKYLPLLIPGLDRMDIQQIVQLRSREENTFLAFRGKLRRVADEVRNATSCFGAKDAIGLFNDELKQGIEAIERQAKHARLDSLAPLAESGLALGSVVLGVHFGILSSNLGDWAQLLGIPWLAKQLVDAAKCADKRHLSAPQNDLYFLWKLQKKKHKRV